MAGAEENCMFFPKTSTEDQNTSTDLDDTIDNQPETHILGENWKIWAEDVDRESYKAGIKFMINPEEKAMSQINLSPIKNFCRVLLKAPTADTMSQRCSAYGRVWRWINKIRNSQITKQEIQSSGIMPVLKDFLDDTRAAQRRDGGISYALEEELTIIYRKLRREDYSFKPQRGLNEIEFRDDNGNIERVSYRLDKGWPLYKSAQAFGDNGLINGQLWFSRLQLMRDGAHGSKIGGISGTVDNGAYSVVMGLPKSNNYQDKKIDNDGNTIEYQGTTKSAVDAAKNPTNVTRALQRSLQTGQEVRVIKAIEIYDPTTQKMVTAYRYDGLYQVTRELPMWTFRMRRMDGQGPIRKHPNASSQ